jgi:hypothetical protein
MEELAERTGGRAFSNTNDLTGAIAKAVEDAETTYTLGFYPEAESLDGKFHELKIHLKRSGLEVRYPRGYFALNDAAAAALEGQDRVRRTIESPLESSSIHVVVRLDRTPESLRIAGSIDLADLQLTHDQSTWKGAVDVDFVHRKGDSPHGRTIREEVEYPTLLDFPAPILRAYPKETVMLRSLRRSPNSVC